MRILGIGLGLFIALLLWTLTLFVYVILWRSKGVASYMKLVCFAVASTVTLLLTFIPKSQEVTTSVEELQVYDGSFIGRVTLVVVMGIFALLGCILMVLLQWSQPIYATPLKPLPY
ncbi:hypothetical protein CHUAL_001701 [Chamberlinius hualienensis]